MQVSEDMGPARSSRGEVHPPCCSLLSPKPCLWDPKQEHSLFGALKLGREPGSSSSSSSCPWCEAVGLLPPHRALSQQCQVTLWEQGLVPVGRSVGGWKECLVPALGLFGLWTYGGDGSARHCYSPAPLLPLSPEPLASPAQRAENAHLNTYKEANQMSSNF